MREPCRTDGNRRGIEYVPFIILAHPQLQFGAQIAQIPLIETQEAEDLLFRMGMRLTAPMPFAAATIKPPGEIDGKIFQVLAIEPDNLIAVARAHAALGGP